MMRMREERNGKNNKKKKEEIGIYCHIEASPLMLICIRLLESPFREFFTS